MRSAITHPEGGSRWLAARPLPAVLTAVALAAALACTRTPAPAPDAGRAFGTPEEAARALVDSARAGAADDILAIFGPDGRDLLATSDKVSARQRLEVFTVAAAERWELVDDGKGGRTLVIGHEAWPFPVPLTRDARGWKFDTAAGREEVLARRIGRNELAVIGICRTYVAAQRVYAARPHDGRRAGLYATAFRSAPGREDGLYWPPKPGAKPSPLGDLVVQAAADGQARDTEGGPPTPFHGYRFRILAAQGPAAPGGERSYLKDGVMSGGFALIAWPATYDATGIMTFIVNQDGVIHEKDLGPDTEQAARAITAYQPDDTWQRTR
jgi:hypothetical protein